MRRVGFRRGGEVGAGVRRVGFRRGGEVGAGVRRGDLPVARRQPPAWLGGR